jgi:hypothetical protein
MKNNHFSGNISVYWLWEFNKRTANSRQNREQIAIASKIQEKLRKYL